MNTSRTPCPTRHLNQVRKNSRTRGGTGPADLGLIIQIPNSTPRPPAGSRTSSWRSFSGSGSIPRVGGWVKVVQTRCAIPGAILDRPRGIPGGNPGPGSREDFLGVENICRPISRQWFQPLASPGSSPYFVRHPLDRFSDLDNHLHVAWGVGPATRQVIHFVTWSGQHGCYGPTRVRNAFSPSRGVAGSRNSPQLSNSGFAGSEPGYQSGYQ